MAKRYIAAPKTDTQKMASITQVVDPSALEVKGYSLDDIDYLEHDMPQEIGQDPKLMSAIASSLLDKVESGVQQILSDD